MDVITNVFERVAVALRSLGLLLGIVGTILVFLNLISFGQLSSDQSWSLTIIMLWAAGLAILIYWFKPTKFEGLGPDVAVVSYARRYGRPMQIYVTIFFVVWFAFVALITASLLADVG